MTRAAIYVRVSQNRTDDRAKPDRQIESCRHLIAAKGLEEVDVYTDDDISAYKAKLRRPAYERLLTDITNGDVDVVVSWHIDRMLRTVKEMTTFIELAEKTGVTLESVQGGSIDLGTPAGRMMATILAAVAQAEAELKAERHKLRNDYAARQGKSMGGPTPFGWQTPQQETALSTGIQAYLAGDSLSAIAKEWNAQGLTTTFGKAWTHNSVRKVLTRPRNAGLVEHRGAVVDGVKGDWRPLCSEDEWRACVAISEAGKRPFRPPEHLLTNLISCENDHKMVSGVAANGKYRYPVYRCMASGCRASIRRDPLDHYIRTLVRYRLTFEDMSLFAPKAAKVTSLRKQRGELLKERQDLEDLLAEKTLSAAGFKKAVAPVDTELTRVDEKLEQAEAENAFTRFMAEKVTSQPLSTAAQVGARFDSLELADRRAIVSHLFPKITVNKPGKNVRLPYPERVTVINEQDEIFVLHDSEY